MNLSSYISSMGIAVAAAAGLAPVAAVSQSYPAKPIDAGNRHQKGLTVVNSEQ